MPQLVVWPDRSATGPPAPFALEPAGFSPIPSGSVIGVIYSTIVQLTDAQIKALPTVPLVLIPAPPSAGAIIGVERVLVEIDSTAGAYGNIDAGATLTLVITGGAIQLVLPLTEAAGDITGLMANGRALGDLIGFALPASTTFAARAGLGVSLTVANGALGNFNGGNAANRGSVSIAYRMKVL